MNRDAIRLGGLIAAVVAVGLFVLYAVTDVHWQECEVLRQGDPERICPRYSDIALSLTVILAGIIAFFGTLAIPGAQNPDGTFREQRVRFSIAVTLIVVYVVYFGMSVFWETGRNEMVDTLTNLMMVVLPFYFGTSAAVEWGARSSRGRNGDGSSRPGQSAS